MSEEKIILYSKVWPRPLDPPSITLQAELLDGGKMYRVEVTYRDGSSVGLSGEFASTVEDPEKELLRKTVQLLSECLADEAKGRVPR